MLFGFTIRPLHLIIVVQQLSASVWLLKLHALNTRLSVHLLSVLGLERSEIVWDDFWYSSCIYVCVRGRPAMTSLGPLIYVGETDNMSQRFKEHLSRLLACFGSTQQPFFDVLRCS